MKYQAGEHINMIVHFDNVGRYIVVKEFDQEKVFFEYLLKHAGITGIFNPSLFIQFLEASQYVIQVSESKKWDLTAISLESRGYTPEIEPEYGFPADDTELLVNLFAETMRAKLKAAEEKYGWTDEWTNPNNVSEMRRNLHEHIEKGDPIDVANFAAFLWHHNAPTSFPVDPNC